MRNLNTHSNWLSTYAQALPAVLVASSLAWMPAIAPAQEPAKAPAATNVSADASIESLFADFIHYARMGQFTAADAYAKALLNHPQLDPAAVHTAAMKDKKSLDTLVIIIRNSSIGDNAAKVMDLIEQGENLKRKDPEVIKSNVELLGGDPQQEMIAIQRLAQSGEYAVPAMIRTLLDPAQQRVWPRVIQAMPKIGKDGLNPLVMALQVRNDDVRLNVIRSLGEIGYAQAIPYLMKLSVDEKMSSQVRDAATKAVSRIEEVSGRQYPGDAPQQFYSLADQYYNEADAVKADSRLNDANVWYWDNGTQTLNAIVVPTKIFGQVMAMRCTEEALKLQSDHAESIALWLAANIRREGRLRLDVESGDASQTGEKDATRPTVFPRALYFTQAAGPLYAQLVLDRAVRSADSPVALGSIEALRLTAGESSLFSLQEGAPPLVAALEFPDLVVRIRAALALGGALPKSEFQGSPLVVPVLASALNQSGKEQVIVVDPDAANLNRIVGGLRAGGREVVGESSLYRALERARVELQAVSGLFIATDIKDPIIDVGMQELRGEFLFSKTPVVLLTKQGQSAVSDRLMKSDSYVEVANGGADDATLTAALQRVRERTRQTAIDSNVALSMALQSAETLRRIAVDGETVLNFETAEPALIGALQSPSEDLQTRAAAVLALVRTSTAQRAIGHVALEGKYSKTLRLAAFGFLAESGKVAGLQLEDAQVTELVKIAREEQDLDIRTAASKALGALNVKTNQASEIIRSYHHG